MIMVLKKSKSIEPKPETKVFSSIADVIKAVAEKTEIAGVGEKLNLLLNGLTSGQANANTRPFSCWTCKHLEPFILADGHGNSRPTWINGSCRATPSPACCTPNTPQYRESAQPIWPTIPDDLINWCSAWQQRQAQDDLGQPDWPPHP